VNYRHRFHAGNIADVFKHLVLVQVLGALRAKDKPFCAIDTHAGSGLYRLRKPGECEQGIARLWPARKAWPFLEHYFAPIAALNPRELTVYPGSPWLIAAALRGQDRAVFVEQQPDEAAGLRDNLRGRPRIAIHEADGFAMLNALIPPVENRGLVLIDPPYEKPDEFVLAAQALQGAHRRWRNGCYLLWFPVKARRPVEQLYASVRAMQADALAVELMTLPEDVPQRLNGSGLIAINPPWKLEETLRSQLPPLAEFLAGTGGAPQVRLIPLRPG